MNDNDIEQQKKNNVEQQLKELCLSDTQCDNMDTVIDQVEQAGMLADDHTGLNDQTSENYFDLKEHGCCIFWRVKLLLKTKC